MFLEKCEWAWEECDARHWLLLRMDKEEGWLMGEGGLNAVGSSNGSAKK